MAYSKLVFKRPSITEASELKRQTALHAKPPPPLITAAVDFPPVTLNIQPSPTVPGAIRTGKAHYATVGFSIEIHDRSYVGLIEATRPLVLDQLGLLIGRRSVRELDTVQGKYTLASDLIEVINKLFLEHSHKKVKDLATNIYFTEFLVQ